MGHAAAKNGGQASDQANKRTPGRHRPTHADRSPTRHPPRGQSDTESRMSTVGDSLATAPDGTNRTLTVRHLCGPAQWSVVRALCGTLRQASARAVCDESTQTWFRRRELQLCDESTLSPSAWAALQNSGAGELVDPPAALQAQCEADIAVRRDKRFTIVKDERPRSLRNPDSTPVRSRPDQCSA
jgi:hypothetical protein